MQENKSGFFAEQCIMHSKGGENKNLIPTFQQVACRA